MRLLIFAYACEPGKGSEPGVGWMWARMLARLGDSVIITRENNSASIQEALPQTPERDRMHFEYVDLPAWARFWKRGQRGVRLYYMLWQIAALRKARELNRQRGFTVIWHLTLANAWLGSFAPLAGGSFVYGPVGGGVTPPWRLLPHLGAKGMLYEGARMLMRLAGRYLNPIARLAWRRASLILVQNPETQAWFPAKYRAKTRIFAHAIVEDLPPEGAEERRSDRTAIFAGRLLPWKGIELGIRAVMIAPEWRLLICGEGPDGPRLRRLVHRLDASEKVRFLGHVPRSEVIDLMQNSDVFLFPSLHDDSPLAIAEAMACGLPVICLERGGPPVLVGGSGGRAVSYRGNAKQVSEVLARCLNDALPDRTTVITRARLLTIPSRAEQLRSLLEDEGVLIGEDVEGSDGSPRDL